jgi:hypothetical protein
MNPKNMIKIDEENHDQPEFSLIESASREELLIIMKKLTFDNMVLTMEKAKLKEKGDDENTSLRNNLNGRLEEIKLLHTELKELIELRNEVTLLRTENETLRGDIQSLKNENKAIKDELNVLKSSLCAREIGIQTDVIVREYVFPKSSK